MLCEHLGPVIISVYKPSCASVGLVLRVSVYLFEGRKRTKGPSVKLTGETAERLLQEIEAAITDGAKRSKRGETLL
jgi:hypothetical protein